VGGCGGEAGREEGFEAPVGEDHLREEEEQAGHVPSVGPAVPEAAQPKSGLTRPEAAHGVRRSRAQRVEDEGDAALDLRHASEGQPRGQEAHDLPVGAPGLRAHELQGIRVHEAMVVRPVEMVEPSTQDRFLHPRDSIRRGRRALAVVFQIMKQRAFHDGRADGLVPLESLDLDRVDSFASLLRSMAKTAFSGRSLGEAFEITLAMVKDPDCKVVLTLSGAMTIAKMGKVISKMIDAGMVHCLVSTGALMAHGLSEAVGMVHYRHDPRMSDEELFDKGYNRVYDTLEMEANLNYVEDFTAQALDRLDGSGDLSSELICRKLGEVLSEEAHGSGVLRSAFLKNVPVFVPAFTD